MKLKLTDAGVRQLPALNRVLAKKRDAVFFMIRR
jgi:hypothetical protein